MTKSTKPVEKKGKFFRTVSKILFPVRVIAKVVLSASKLLLPLFRLGKSLIKKNRK